MLYEVCRKENERSYFVSDIDDLNMEWFKESDVIGICGATSTPMWLMEKIAETIQK
jgi:4-hydroxy-3-methylbut-2-enyl diphosphate reductase